MATICNYHFMHDSLFIIDLQCSPSVTRKTTNPYFTRHLFSLFSPMQSPLRMLTLPENHMRLPALLSPVPRQGDAHTEGTAAQKCAPFRAGPGDSCTSTSPGLTRFTAQWVRG